MVVDRQLRPDATVLAVGAHTVDTRELHEDVLRGAQVIVEDGRGRASPPPPFCRHIHPPPGVGSANQGGSVLAWYEGG